MLSAGPAGLYLATYPAGGASAPMAYFRPLRTIAGCRLWPGLLLGSTGLALTTTLLLLLTHYASTAVPVTWAATAASGFELSRRMPTGVDSQPLAMRAPSSLLPHALADTYPYSGRSGLLPESGASRLQPRGSGPNQPDPTPVAGPMRMVQRSWSTVKLMFR